MNKLIITLVLLSCFVSTSMGQSQGMLFEFGFGINPISSKSTYQKSTGAGLSLYLNSYYYFKSKFAVGAELITSSSLMSGNSPNIDLQTTSINAILFGGRYHIQRHNGFISFGLKVGRYKIKPEGSSQDFFLFIPYNIEEFTFEERNVIGFAPEIGRTFGHFQIAFCVHFPTNYKASVRGSSGSRFEVSNQYKLYQLKIGLSLYDKKKPNK